MILAVGDVECAFAVNDYAVRSGHACLESVATVAFIPGSLLTLAAGAIFGLVKGGVVVFTMSNAGLMYEASVGGQKFKFEAVGGE